MYIGFLPVVLVVVSLASILVGIRGLMEGRRIGQMEGRNALMHFPVPLPWLKKRVTAARWVVWIGHLYLSTGLVGLLGAWLIGMTPAQSSHTHICNQLADRLVALYAEELRGGGVETKGTPDGCATTLYDHKKVRWFAVQSKRPIQHAGSTFNEEKQILERSAYRVTSIDGLGSRAALAETRNGAGLNPVLFYTNGLGHHRVEMNSLQIDRERQRAVIEALKLLPMTSPD